MNQNRKMAEKEGLELFCRLEAKLLANADFAEESLLENGRKGKADAAKGRQKQVFGLTADNLREARVDEIQGLVPEFPVYGEMPAVGRNDLGLRKDFRQAHHGCVAKIHLRIFGR